MSIKLESSNRINKAVREVGVAGAVIVGEEVTGAEAKGEVGEGEEGGLVEGVEGTVLI